MLKTGLQGLLIAIIIGLDVVWVYWFYRIFSHGWTSKNHIEKYWWCPTCWINRGFAKIATAFKHN